MESFVLDTTAITDVRLRVRFGCSDLSGVVEKAVSEIARAHTDLGYRFYMTPSLRDELRRFLAAHEVPVTLIDKIFAWVIVKSPRLSDVKIPALIMRSYVEEVRRRIDKGLRVAEDAVWRAVREARTANSDEASVAGPIVRDLREKYREATRRGAVDSTVDFELAILAVELNACLVTADEGLTRLCEGLGVPCLDPVSFYDLLDERLRAKTSKRQ